MYGNVAPTGAVAKITGKEGERFQGTAKVFDSEEDMLAAIASRPSPYTYTSRVSDSGARRYAQTPALGSFLS